MDEAINRGISQRELDARIMAIIKQRNDSMDREAALMGEIACAREYIKELQRQVTDLIVKRQGTET